MEAWEPLPPRKNKRRGGGDTSAAGTDAGVESESSEGNIRQSQKEESALETTQRTLAENIETRTKQVWAHQTLESKDGCASECA